MAFENCEDRIKKAPNVAALGNWICSWVQPDGAIYGFHNHSVWGGNPYRWSDFTCSHTTWASPFLPGLSFALSKQMNKNGLELLEKLIKYQTNSFQKDGQYDYIGFQIGESLKFGLIHNAVPNISLGLTALYGRDFLSEEALESIKQSIIKNMKGCEIYGGGRAGINACCNQDYARIWAKFLFQIAYKDNRWNDEIFEDLDYLIDNFHVKGLPDNDCEATYRSLTNNDRDIVEPAEYYGLMISPLVIAYEMTGNKKYLQHAGALCRHVVRSTWQDNNGQVRFSRLWLKDGDSWTMLKGPMLIAGMGITLYGISSYIKYDKDEELIDFLEKCDETYVYYQTQRGFFVSATGWQSEVDVAPSTAWHAHDFIYLITRYGVHENFWSEFEAEYKNMSILLGEQCIWMEDGMNWTITDYLSQDVFQLLGRKDRNIFGRDMVWVGGDRALPEDYTFNNKPIFYKTEEGIYLKNQMNKKLDIYNIASVPYIGSRNETYHK